LKIDNIKLKFIVFIVVMIQVLSSPLWAQRAVDYLDISNPYLRKIPVAIPLFKYLPENDEAKSLSAEITVLMTDTLEFTGFFKIIDPKSFLVDLQKSGISGNSLNFQSWTAIGAELLVTGGFELKDNLVVMELRLYDTFNGRLLVGKKYKGWKSDSRRIIRKFCNEIILRLTGTRGFFDSRIIFVSNGTGNKELYICDFDGFNIQRVTYHNTISLSPAWSSDGKWIAYTSYKKRKPDLYIWNLKERRGSVIDFNGINVTPAWRPNRFSLAAALSKSGNSEIYLLTGTGKIVKRLTFDWGIDISPSWSPDGKQIAFVSNRCGSAQIYILDVATGKAKRITFEGKYNSSPAWSPRGDKIAFSGRNNGRFDIFVINTDGSNISQLTRNNSNNESPNWSPDGNLIVFSSNRSEKNRIYVMTAYGTDQRQLLSMPGEQSEPSWSQ